MEPSSSSLPSMDGSADGSKLRKCLEAMFHPLTPFLIHLGEKGHTLSHSKMHVGQELTVAPNRLREV